MKKILSVLLIPVMLSMAAAVPAFAESNEVKIYVSLNGNDANDGKQLTSAVKTASRAVELERMYKTDGKITHIIFKEGTYFLDDTVNLTSEDSGTKDAPVVFGAYQGDNVRFTMGKKLDPNAFKISGNAQIADSARRYVYEADLEELDNLAGGFTDTFYVDGCMQNLSAFPNRDSSKKAHTYEFTQSEDGTAYLIPEEKLSGWANRTDMLYSFMPTGYTWQSGAVGEVTDTTIKLAGKSAIIYNLLCEVDEPGEYYIDKEAKKLYYYPQYDISTSDMYLSTGNKNFVTIKNASNIKFEGIDFICANSGFSINGCNNITIYDSVMKAMAGYAVNAAETSGLQILKCDISDLKRGAVSVSGGDSVKLISSGNLIKNCRIHDFGEIYKSSYGVEVKGVGAIFAHNEVYNCSSIAVTVAGNDIVVENNRIYNTMLNVWDSGSIYMGRTWTGRGNIVRNNYIYDSRELLDFSVLTDLHYWAGTDNQGIYLDDMISGITVTGNIVYNMSRGMLIGGGSDNNVENNVIINCRRGSAYDNRGMNWGYKHLEELEQYSGWIYKGLKSLIADKDYNEETWTTQYPEFTEVLKRKADFDKEVEGITDLGKRAAIIRKTIGRPFNVQVHNNIYTGSYANDYIAGNYSTYISQTNGYNYDGTVQPRAADDHRAVTDTEAGISINGYEITIAGSNLPAGISRTTADMGITADDYVPSYSENEFDVNAANRFVAYAAIYDGNGSLKSVQSFNNCYIYDGQIVNLSIDVPGEADNEWYASVMLWNGTGGMKPVLKQKIMLLNQTD